jgi:hypothetical protein
MSDETPQSDARLLAKLVAVLPQLVAELRALNRYHESQRPATMDEFLDVVDGHVQPTSEERAPWR